ncbi:hypothetical protein FD16_GL001480 [Paucilactobacillus suebicus DSM 5007 = KCTC 3549]|uniref:Accessory Sec system protein Asp3 n=2 Tax=Paucilactobacillus suebicus TaxID=152335 RepID=A0A0R1W237_9LACO|nr:hypothetical protein FD16_GL001480 [Paucilactobacillus suebicus DSM 5007 = KCTC 3549]
MNGREQMNNLIYIIRWPREQHDTYNYGATISFDDSDRVSYASPMMPPGQALHTWHSATNYITQKTGPALPLLKQGVRYHIAAQFNESPAESVYVAIRFFDEDKLVVDEQFFNAEGGRFTYPFGAVRYDIALVNASHQSLTFDFLELAEQRVWGNFEFDYDSNGGLLSATPKQFDDVADSELVLTQKNFTTVSCNLNTQRPIFYLLLNQRTTNNRDKTDLKLKHAYQMVMEKIAHLTDGTPQPGKIHLSRQGTQPDYVMQEMQGLLNDSE